MPNGSSRLSASPDAAAPPGPEVAFFCEGSRALGLGHVERCLAVARALRDGHGAACRFVFRGDDDVLPRLGEFAVTRLERADDFSRWNPDRAPAAAVLDLRHDLEPAFFDRLRARGVFLAALDDPTANRLRCDLVFYPPVPQTQALDWAGFSGTVLRGWEYVPLRREFARPKDPAPAAEPDPGRPRLLVAMGGSDPRGLAGRVLRVLGQLSQPRQTTVAAGALDARAGTLAALAGPDIVVRRDVRDMASLMRASDLAVAAFGMTAYELAACRVPQLLLCLTDDHALSASALHRAGAAVSLGRHDAVTDRTIGDTLNELLGQPQRRDTLRAGAAALDLGAGAANIAAALAQRMENGYEKRR